MDFSSGVKAKTIFGTNPKIISRIDNGVPYYEIEYFDKTINDVVIGFGSYKKEIVDRWLKEYFEPSVH